MAPRGGILLVLTALLLTTPLATAEFGPESDEGWPINVEGEELLPPVEPVKLPAMRPVDGAHAPHAEAAEPLNKAGPFTVFPYYGLLTAELQRLASDHPDLVKLTSAGKSRAGLDLWLLEIANFDAIEAGEGIPLEEREVVYLDGGTHSNEYSGVYFVTEVAQFLLDEYETNETAQWIVDNRHTWILPLVNPDGSHAFGRMNAVWVNINRNFPAIWNEVDENVVVNNPGPAPASEPETQTVLEVLESIQPDYVNSIHCCGNLWLHPYGHEDFQAEEDDLEMFTRICDEVFEEVREDCGPIWSTIYPASGTTADTGYDLHGASSWTYEMSGRGAVAPWGQPVITEDVRVQERESWDGVIHAMLNTEKYGAHPVLEAIEGTTDELTATVTNTGYQTLRAGTLTLGEAQAELPVLAPGETGRITLEGTFQPGEVTGELAWQKRVKHAPWGALSLTAVLTEGTGQLVATLDLAEDALTLNRADEGPTPTGENIPVGPLAPLLALLVAAMAAGAARRRA